VLDAGDHLNACTVAALFTAEQIYLVANPDVPSIRNAQRVMDKVRQLGACSDRVRLLLNRTTDPLPIPRKHIEDAVGCPIYYSFSSDYKTVSPALNSGEPLVLTRGSEIAKQAAGFTRRVLNPAADVATAPTSARGLGLQRVASLW